MGNWLTAAMNRMAAGTNNSNATRFFILHHLCESLENVTFARGHTAASAWPRARIELGISMGENRATRRAVCVYAGEERAASGSCCPLLDQSSEPRIGYRDCENCDKYTHIQIVWKRPIDFGEQMSRVLQVPSFGIWDYDFITPSWLR